MANQEDDLENKFRENDFPEENDIHHTNHDYHGGQSDGGDDEEEEEEEPTKKRLDIKKLALPALFIALLGGYYVGKPYFMGTTAQPPAPSSIHHAPAGLPKPTHNGLSLNTASNDVAPTGQLPPRFGGDADTVNTSSPPSPAITNNQEAVSPQKVAPFGDTGLHIPSSSGVPVNNGDVKNSVTSDNTGKSEPNKLENTHSTLSSSDNGSLTDILSKLDQNNILNTSNFATVNNHVDDVKKAVEDGNKQVRDDIVSLQNKLKDMSDKIDNIEAKPVKPDVKENEKSISKVKGKGVHLPTPAHKVIKKRSQKPVKKTSEAKIENGLISDYHLRAVSKHEVLLSGPNGYFKVPVGSQAMQGNSPVGAVGVVQGIEKRGDRYVIKTSTGVITE